MLYPYNRQVLPNVRNLVRVNHKLTIEDDLQWEMTLRVQIYPTVVYMKFQILR
jgi:hypothetical protein